MIKIILSALSRMYVVILFFIVKTWMSNNKSCVYFQCSLLQSNFSDIIKLNLDHTGLYRIKCCFTWTIPVKDSSCVFVRGFFVFVVRRLHHMTWNNSWQWGIILTHAFVIFRPRLTVKNNCFKFQIHTRKQIYSVSEPSKFRDMKN